MKKYRNSNVEWTYLNQDVIRDWSQSPDLENITENTLFEEESQSGDEQDAAAQDVYMEHMDIREPIETLRDLLTPKLGFSLKNYDFWLQDTNLLQPRKNLVDQCIQGEGLVQINCQINRNAKKINIVDILKPSNDVLAKGPTDVKKDPNKPSQSKQAKSDDTGTKRPSESNANRTAAPTAGGSTTNHWAIDNQFKRDQARLKIPDNPCDWNQSQVKFWLNWAIRQFSTTEINRDDWNITGEELSTMTINEFKKKCPKDPGDLFWTHFELLRKCKYVAVWQKNGPPTTTQGPSPPKRVRPTTSSPATVPQNINSVMEKKAASSPVQNPRTGSNGQIQLWQFLLDILTDFAYKEIIQWDGFEGEFKLLDPEQVAQLWGVRKNKPYMNYEKLSRALRYYYDGDMIAKVQGKRFVYKFICNLQQLIGYDARELAMLVEEQS